jgi:hypothetical protein
VGLGAWGRETYLEVDDDEDYEHGGEQTGQVGRVLSVEGVLEGVDFVALGEEEVEESDDGSFELGSLVSSDGDGGETLPQDVFADVGGDKQGDSTSETVALLEELVEKDHNDTGSEELEENQNGVNGSEVGEFTVHARQEIGEGLSKSDDQAKELLGSLEEFSVLLGGLVDFDDLGTCEQLHDHAGSDDGGYSKLHKGSLIRGKDYPKPIEGVGSFLLNHTVKRDLAADKIDEKSDGSPNELVIEELLTIDQKGKGLTFFIGCSTSGRRPMTGRTRSINLTRVVISRVYIILIIFNRNRQC